MSMTAAANPNTNEKLSHEDIKALMENPDNGTKIRVIEKLSNQYNAQDFTEAQVGLAEQIFRLLLKQAEIEVRKALSENLMSSKAVPHDIVLSLARDVEEVAVPVLQFSDVLTDDDLVEIIRSTHKVAPQMAIAGRREVSEKVSAELVHTHDEAVVQCLLENTGARISELSFQEVTEHFPASEKIVEAMITRGSLPNKVIERLTLQVSGALRKKLEQKYEGSFKEINEFFQESGRVAAFKFLGMQKIDKDLMALVDDLEKDGKLEQALHPLHGMLTHLLDGLEQLGQLTPLSALALGHLTLFEISLSRLTGVPFTNVHKLVGDRDSGLQALYDVAQLPPPLFEAVQFAADTVRVMERETALSGTPRPRDNQFLYIKRLISDSKGKPVKNLSHFISIIRHHLDSSSSEW